MSLLVLVLLSSYGILEVIGKKSSDDKWPGSEKVDAVDKKNEFGENLSGLMYDSITSSRDYPILWAIQNNPSTIYKLLYDNDKEVWSSDKTDEWGGHGKRLRFMDGYGNPDAEDLVIPAVIQRENKGMISFEDSAFLSDMYVCTERNDIDGEDHISRMSILRYNVNDISSNNSNNSNNSVNGESQLGLNAIQEWRLNEHLPLADDNLGLEGISWIPDSHLVELGFIDVNTGSMYNPMQYGDHGEGVFLVGLESTGSVYFFVLDEYSTSSNMIGSFKSHEESIMSLYYDADTRYLWSLCDNTCSHVTQSVYTIQDGQFKVAGSYTAPKEINDLNIEGYTMVPNTKCDESGVRNVYWADDGNYNDHAIRHGTVSCGNFIE